MDQCVSGYCNILIKLKSVTRFINKKELYNFIVFHNTKRKCVGKDYFDMKESDITKMNNKLQIKVLGFMKKYN